MKFYICKHCGNLIMMIKDSGVNPHCCGEAMSELVPGTTDAATEKHVPVFETQGNSVKVKVGSVEHPMEEAHYIQWIAIETTNGCQIKHLAPGGKPEAEFILAKGENLVAVYEYCSLHGLWKA